LCFAAVGQIGFSTLFAEAMKISVGDVQEECAAEIQADSPELGVTNSPAANCQVCFILPFFCVRGV